MKSYCATDVGKVRKMNQDSVYASSEQVGSLPNLFIVADGMGGHKAGDLASKLTVETVTDIVSSLNASDPITVIRKAIERANSAVLGKSKESLDYQGMGTTCVISCVIENNLYVANIGDSRLYVIDKEITQITRDHSLVEELVSRGQLARKDARTNRNKNIITRAIGGQPVVMADFFEVKLKPKDRILMCTDGLTNMVEDEELLRIIGDRRLSLREVAKRLIDAANVHGGKDNIGVVLIEPEV